MTTCANHVCHKDLDNKVLCPLCRNAQYCSEACRKTDWVKHACPNARIAAHPNDVQVIEYAWEDDVPSEVLAEEIGENVAHPFLNAYTTTYFTPDGHAESKIHTPAIIDADAAVKRESVLGSYKRGATPPGDLAAQNYTIAVKILDEAGNEMMDALNIYGIIGKDAIYDKNDTTRVKRLLGELPMETEGKEKFTDRLRRYGRKLLSFGSKEGGSMVIWPDLQTNNLAVRKFKMPEEATIVFEFWSGTGDDAKKIYELRGPYSFRASRKMSRFTRAFQKRLTQRLRAKFPNDSDNIKNMATYRMEAGGQRVVFTVEPISNTGVFLRDVEFAINASQFRFAASEITPDVRERVSVDASSVDQMTGLVMCLETRIANGDKSYADISSVLRPYTRELEKNGSIHEDDIPDSIHTAVYTAVNRLAAEKNTE